LYSSTKRLLTPPPPQIQASLPSLRATSGRILLVSSGASVTPYVGWACYGASKAVFNHIASSLGVEEPLVTSLSIRPGVVDTQMQRDIREVHHTNMSETDREKFKGLKEGGKLLRPEQPGNVLARLAVAEGEQFTGLSGKFLSWDDEKLGAWQED
jgi:NAD(P)-dependent dehydrogenase (short-subunit alcohol dehydrogenase family)